SFLRRESFCSSSSVVILSFLSSAISSQPLFLVYIPSEKEVKPWRTDCRTRRRPLSADHGMNRIRQCGKICSRNKKPASTRKPVQYKYDYSPAKTSSDRKSTRLNSSHVSISYAV